MDFEIVLMLGGALLAVAMHVYALWMSRGTRSRAATVAFLSGVTGLLSIPVALTLVAAAIPYFVTGAPETLNRAILVSLSVAAALPVVSLLAATMVLREEREKGCETT